LPLFSKNKIQRQKSTPSLAVVFQKQDPAPEINAEPCRCFPKTTDSARNQCPVLPLFSKNNRQRQKSTPSLAVVFQKQPAAPEINAQCCRCFPKTRFSARNQRRALLLFSKNNRQRQKSTPSLVVVFQKQPAAPEINALCCRCFPKTTGTARNQRPALPLFSKDNMKRANRRASLLL
jgi:hypothetical protein